MQQHKCLRYSPREAAIQLYGILERPIPPAVFALCDDLPLQRPVADKHAAAAKPATNTASHIFSNRATHALHLAIQNGWSSSTLRGYKRAVAHFNAFCDTEGVPPSLRLPADEFVLCAYAASSAGVLSAGMVQSRLAGLKAWHSANGLQWPGETRLRVVINGVKNLAPPHSARPPRPPITLAMLADLARGLDNGVPIDVAVLACATMAFWGQCRLGELLGESQFRFDTSRLPSWANLFKPRSAQAAHSVFLPSTKTHRSGETVVLITRDDFSDPATALKWHFHVNSALPAHSPMFAYHSNNGPRMLTKCVFMTRCNSIWAERGYPRSTGHSFRIGGTSELLAMGMAPDVVRSMGRWSSDAFLRYWRGLDEIAPAHILGLAQRTRDREPHANRRHQLARVGLSRRRRPNQSL